MFLHVLCNQWFPSIPTSQSLKKSNYLFSRRQTHFLLFLFFGFLKQTFPLCLSVSDFHHNIPVLKKKVTYKSISLSNSHPKLVKTFQIFFFILCSFSLNRMKATDIEQTEILILFTCLETLQYSFPFSSLTMQMHQAFPKFYLN